MVVSRVPKSPKQSIGVRILSAVLKTDTTRRHEAYQKYVNRAVGKPLSFRKWAEINAPPKSKPKPVKTPPKDVTTTRTKTITGQLRRSGLSQRDIDSLRGK